MQDQIYRVPRFTILAVPPPDQLLCEIFPSVSVGLLCLIKLRFLVFGGNPTEVMPFSA